VYVAGSHLSGLLSSFAIFPRQQVIAVLHPTSIDAIGF
jgi:hypothetical protein